MEIQAEGYQYERVPGEPRGCGNPDRREEGRILSTKTTIGPACMYELQSYNTESLKGRAATETSPRPLQDLSKTSPRPLQDLM